MKRSHLLLSLLVLSFLFSCSKEKGYGLAIPKETAINYFPLALNNQWSYHNTIELSSPAYHQESDETLRVSNTGNENETTSYLFSSSVVPKKRGVSTSLLANGKINKVRGKVIYNGNFIFRLPILGDSIRLPLHNFLLLNQNAGVDELLSTAEGTLQDTLQFGDSLQLPATIVYNLQATGGKAYVNYPNNGQTFNNVISSKLTLNLSATATLPDGFSLEIIVPQKVLTSTNYFAKEIGLIYNQTTIHVVFEDLSEYTVSQIDSIVGASSQILTQYALPNL